MGFWQHILGFFRRETKKGAVAPGTVRAGATAFFGYGCQNALGIATVFRCVKLLSESVANLPLLYLKRKDGVFVEADDRRLDYLLNVQPDFAINAFDFRKQLVQELILDGNAYIVPVYNTASMELDRLVLCGRGTVAHDTVNDIYVVNDSANAIYGTFAEDEIIHVKGLTLRDNKRGVSVLTYARLTMDIASTGDQGIVSNDTSVRGFGEYQDKQLDRTAENLDNRFQSGERIVGLPGQVDFKQISLSSTDMQFLESRKFTVIEICRFFSVPPTFVYADTSNNYKTVEQADVDFLSHTLNPLLRNIEIELRRKLIAPSLSHKYKFEFDRRELFACDLSGMMNYGAKLLQLGATINEVRRLNNLAPVEGGDTAFVSANLRGINEVGAQQLQATGASENKKDDNEDSKE